MNRVILVALIGIWSKAMLAAPAAGGAPSPRPAAAKAIVADHTAVDQFEKIPDAAIAAASRKRVLQVHASTGGIIDDNGLNCLQGTRPSDLVSYPKGKYDRRNWTWPMYNPWCTSFADKVNQFRDQWVPKYKDQCDILSMKLCYIDRFGMDFNYYRDTLLKLEKENPGKIFIWWTYPILNQWPEPAWCKDLEKFNQQVRAFAAANGKPLFDIAAIESHDEQGRPRAAAAGESVWPQYGNPANPVDGHPNAYSAVRLAKAYWWLIARLSGWDGAPAPAR